MSSDTTIREIISQSGLTVRVGEQPRASSADPCSRLGRYPVTGHLGAGGMGEVLQVRDEDLGRDVAAKVIRGKSDPVLLSKFVLEAQVTGQLEHPNIVPMHELGLTPDQKIYFTMKRVEGQTLEALLDQSREGEGKTLYEYLQVFLRVCDAIAFAHSRGVIHRDLKPANIMVGQFGEVQVMDWGLARILDQPDLVGAGCQLAVGEGQLAGLAASRLPEEALKTQDGTVVGTIAYMPPEQARGELDRLDQRADIYALGAILYELLTLEVPFEGDNMWSLLHRVMAGDILPPSRRTPERDIPWELEAVVTTAMDPELEKRYAGVAEMKADIEAYLEGRALAAADYSAWQILVKWVRRHRTASIGLAMLLCGLVAAWGIQRAQRRAGIAKTRQAMLAAREESRALSAPTAGTLAGWYAAHQRWLAASRLLVREAPEDPEGRRALIEVAVAMSHQMIEDRNWQTAELMLDEARSAGLAGPALSREQRRLAEARDRQRKQEVARTRAILGSLNEPPARGMLDEYVTRLVKMPRGHVVAELIPAVYGATVWQRMLAAEALGKIGNGVRSAPVDRARIHRSLPGRAAPNPDTFFRDALAKLQATVLREWVPREGTVALTASQAIALRLLVVDPVQSLEESVTLAWALCRLRGPRAYEVLQLKRWASGEGSSFYERTAVPIGWLPPPPDSARDGARVNNRGIALLEQGKLSEALQHFERAIALMPRASEPHVNRALVLRKQGALHRARQALDRAIVLDSSNARAYHNRSLIQLALSRPAAALEDIGKAIAIDGRSHVFRIDRAKVLRVRGKLEAARADLLVALKLAPGNAQVLAELGETHARLSDAEKAALCWKRSLALDPSNPGVYRARARAHLRAGNLAAASADLDSAVRLAPRDTSALILRAQTRVRLGNREGSREDCEAVLRVPASKAIAQYDRALALDMLGRTGEAISALDRLLTAYPSYIEGYVLRVTLHLNQGDLGKALRDAGELIRRSPRLADGYTARGSVYQRQGKLELALADHRRAISLKPHPQHYRNRAIVYSQLGRRELALKDLGEAVRLAPGDPSYRITRGDYYVQLKQHAKAISDYRAALRLARRDFYTMGKLGSLLNSAGDYKAAHGVLVRAVELAPKSWPLRGRMVGFLCEACLRYGQGIVMQRPAEAARLFGQGLRHNPRDVRLLCMRGFAYNRTGQHAAAAKDLSLALQVAPNNVFALKQRGLSFLTQGSLEKARADLLRAARLAGKDWEVWYNLACVHGKRAGARPAGAAEDVQAAIGYLRKALEAGCTLTARQVAEDADLAPLRGQPGFAKVLERLRKR